MRKNVLPKIAYLTILACSLAAYQGLLTKAPKSLNAKEITLKIITDGIK